MARTSPSSGPSVAIMVEPRSGIARMNFGEICLQTLAANLKRILDFARLLFNYRISSAICRLFRVGQTSKALSRSGVHWHSRCHSAPVMTRACAQEQNGVQQKPGPKYMVVG
jgi:hypothetical protein